MPLLGNFFLFLIIVAGLILAWLLFTSAGTRVVTVPQEKRLVIYRLGRFHRLAGPGLEIISRLDSIEREINIRSELANYRTDAWYFMNGLDFNYTISLWSSNDLEQASGGNRKRLERFVQYSDAERRRHLISKLHEAIYYSLPSVQTKYPTASEATVEEKLLPILPGMPGCNELIDLVRKELRANLPGIGIILDEEHRVVVTAVHVMPEVLASLSRGRSLQILREQLPDASSDVLLEAFSAIEGLDIRTMRLRIDGSTNVRELEFDGEKIEHIKVSPVPTAEVKEQAVVRNRSNDRQPAQAPEGEGEETLTKSDLSILKQLA